MVDTFKNLLNENEAFIVNTDLSSGSGIHWIVIYRNNDNLLIIDPLGKKNYRPYDAIMFKTIKDVGLKYKFFDDDIQYSNNSLCGWYSIYVAKLINKNKDKSINEIIDILNSKFKSNGADDDDEKILEKSFGIKSKDKLDKIYDGGYKIKFRKSTNPKKNMM